MVSANRQSTHENYRIFLFKMRFKIKTTIVNSFEKWNCKAYLKQYKNILVKSTVIQNDFPDQK